MFKAGDRVEVLPRDRHEWIVGEVMERRARDERTFMYYVRFKGYVATAPDDSNVWFTAERMRSIDPT